MEWSFDSKYVLCGVFSKSLVQVWSILDSKWACRISEGVAGMVRATWAPDGRHVLTVSDFQLNLTVWSLMDSSSVVIPNPKLGSGAAGACFFIPRCPSLSLRVMTWA